MRGLFLTLTGPHCTYRSTEVHWPQFTIVYVPYVLPYVRYVPSGTQFDYMKGINLTVFQHAFYVCHYTAGSVVVVTVVLGSVVAVVVTGVGGARVADIAQVSLAVVVVVPLLYVY